MAQSGKIAIEFHRSLAMSVSVALSFLGLAEEYEGFDPVLYAMYAALPADLRTDIRILFKPFSNVLLFDGLLRDGIRIDDIPTFIGWITRLPPERVDESNLVCLRSLAEYVGADSQGLCTDWLKDKRRTMPILGKALAKLEHLQPHLDRIASLIADPEALKANVVYVVTRLWDRYLKGEHPQWRALEEQSIEMLGRKALSDSFGEAFRQITGRDYPEASPPLDPVERAIFIPSCLPGPYLSVDRLLGDATALSVVYNCRPTGMMDLPAGRALEGVFPPLKALADETRLEILGILAGRELYAQEIVERMRISQSAVSRHLRLMVACGVLNERKHEGMKFYTVNTEVLARLAARLSEIPGLSDT